MSEFAGLSEKEVKEKLEHESQPNERLKLKARLAEINGDKKAMEQYLAAAAIPEKRWNSVKAGRG